ncbi:hypothetical protein [Candidatus Uabimicrobium sp. HlEnr_7]|uniref:hypothetical protein n=1 Tax=Candidatus Uabimicrobium helgolandensis TaxID=3095367 RepID=UPI003558AC80
MNFSKKTLRFFKSNAGPSFFYIMSAACILLGAAMITIPLYENSNLLAKRFYLVGVLNGYEIALFLVSLLVCRWKKSNSDAISLVCLLGIFIIGSTISLDTVSVEFAKTTLIIGIIGFLFVVLKLHLLFKKILGNSNIYLLTALIFILLPNFIMPGVLGVALENGISTNKSLGSIWILGWWLTIISGIFLVIVAHKTSIDHSEKSQPFLSRKIMQWIFCIIIFCGSVCHQYTTSFSFDLGISLANITPIIAIAVFLAIEYKCIYKKSFVASDIIWMSLPVIVAFIIIFSESFFATTGWEFFSYPAISLAISSCGMFLLHSSKRNYLFRTNNKLLFFIACFYLISAILIWNNSFDIVLTLRIAFLVAFVCMIYYQNFMWGIVVSVLFVINIQALPLLNPLQQARLTYPSFTYLILGTTILVVCGLFPKKTPKTILFIATIFFAIGVYDCFVAYPVVESFYAPNMSGICALLFGAVCSWRYRDVKPFLPSIFPALSSVKTILYSVGQFLMDNKGWMVIFVSFILLALGALASFAKLEDENEKDVIKTT